MQGSRNALPIAGLSASAMDHHHGLTLSTQESIVFTSFFQDVNTFRVVTYNWGTKQILINSTQHKSYGNKEILMNLLKVRTTKRYYKGHGYFGSGFGPSLNMNPT